MSPLRRNIGLSLCALGGGVAVFGYLTIRDPYSEDLTLLFIGGFLAVLVGLAILAWGPSE